MTLRVGTAAWLCMLLALGACGGDAAVPSGPEVTFATLPTSDSTANAAPTAPAPAPETDPSTPPTPPTPPSSVAAEPLGDPSVALVSVGTFAEPVDLAWRAGDPTSFVVERGGTIVPVRDGVTGAPVLDISDLTEGEGEQGLLGLTFSLDGAKAYVNHTDDNGDTVIAEYAVTGGAEGAGGGTFDEASRRVLFTIEQPYANHNGGNVTIGPDGMLYIGMGDGGSGGDPERRALNVATLLGKILRVDPTPSGDLPYTVPADNPFVGIDGARPEIWSVGLRNPWRFSFDSATGDLWVADVGQNVVEEVNVAWASDGGGRGLNFGWSAFEGTRRFNDDQSADGVTQPVHEYEHGDAGCSISGGAVYRGSAIPELVGWYVFGDYCSGRLVGLRMQDRAVADVLDLGVQNENSAVRVGPDGELYALSLGGDISVFSPA